VTVRSGSTAAVEASQPRLFQVLGPGLVTGAADDGPQWHCHLLAGRRAVRVWGLRSPVLIFDAAGLALFAVAGTQKALVVGLNPIMAALLGMLTGIGDGMARDVLLAEIPTVLSADLYALAALAGAAVVVIGATFQLPSTAVTTAGAVLCFGLRFMAIRRG